MRIYNKLAVNEKDLAVKVLLVPWLIAYQGPRKTSVQHRFQNFIEHELKPLAANELSGV